MTNQGISRRDLLRGQPVQDGVNLPPWLQAQHLSKCTACNKCVDACPEQILTLSKKGFPSINFADTGCTFCGDCAAACPEELFGAKDSKPWANVVQINEGCLLKAGVSCQLCTDFCDVEALTFDMSVRPVGALRINTDSCTGCGFCIGSCPTGAIAIQEPKKETAA